LIIAPRQFQALSVNERLLFIKEVVMHMDGLRKVNLSSYERQIAIRLCNKSIRYCEFMCEILLDSYLHGIKYMRVKINNLHLTMKFAVTVRSKQNAISFWSLSYRNFVLIVPDAKKGIH
jgi:hypothetical protein